MNWFDHLAVSHAQDRHALESEVIRFSNSLEFDIYCAVTIQPSSEGSSPHTKFLENTPSTYKDAQLDPAAVARDPVFGHLRRRNTPIVWSQDTYVDAGAGDLWEHQARFGYKSGIAVALHTPGERHMLFGLDRPAPLPSDPTELQQMVAAVQLFAMYYNEAAMRVFMPAEEAVEPPALSQRELEVLRWTMIGKTAWEVGSLLSISEGTAARHLSNATKKLDCVNKHQAVVKAIRLGIISA